MDTEIVNQITAQIQLLSLVEYGLILNLAILPFYLVRGILRP